MASSKKSKSKTQAKRIGVALSGGLDSVVLLDAVSKTYPNDVVYALHIHHGLQTQADEWLLSCERLAKRYGIAFDFRLLHLPITANIEAHAREARYEALLGLCDQHELDQQIADTAHPDIEAGFGSLGRQLCCHGTEVGPLAGVYRNGGATARHDGSTHEPDVLGFEQAIDVDPRRRVRRLLGRHRFTAEHGLIDL